MTKETRQRRADFLANQQKMIRAYAAFCRREGRHPSRADMLEMDYTRDQIRAHFVSLDKLRVAVHAADPTAFDSILDETAFTVERFDALKKAIRHTRRFVITTAVTGCEVDERFYDSIRHYCELNDAQMLVLVCSDPAAAKDSFYLDPMLKDALIVYSDLWLNSHLFLCSIKTSAKQIDPTTGTLRIGQRNGTTIFASPKQRLRCTATSNSELPHVMMTTGALTRPGYETQRYMSERTAYLANHDHIMGALIVELDESDMFHFRQVQADDQGRFADLGVMYGDGKIWRYQPEGLVMGDIHIGVTNAQVWEATLDDDDCIRERVRPKKLFLHDTFDGMSINHHEKDDLVMRAIRAAADKLALKPECRLVSTTLNQLGGWFDEVMVVPSNHDDFLKEYITHARFRHDPQNAGFAAELLAAAIDKKHVLRTACEMTGLTAKNIRFLDMDEDYKVAGIELGCHGHKGANGSRGSVKAMEAAYGNSMSGHAHTPEILRGAWQVGTSSELGLDYNKGPSSWLNTHGLVYDNGMRQLLNIIYGKWALPAAPKLLKALRTAKAFKSVAPKHKAA